MEKITHNIKEDVLALIKKGDTVMRPRWHFVSKTVLFTLAILFLVVAVPYLMSFVVFLLIRTGLLFVPAFGFSGVQVLLLSLPWLLILISVAMIIGLEALLKKYPFTYKKPLVYSLFLILAVAVAGGFLFSKIGAHERLYRLVENRQMPGSGRVLILGGLNGEASDHVTPGIISAVGQSQLDLLTAEEETYTVVIGPKTQLPKGGPLLVGDNVIVLGEKEGFMIKAVGVKKFSKDGRGNFFRPAFPREMERPMMK
jgi:hypothetical protein